MVGVVAMFSGIGLLGTISAMLATTMVSADGNNGLNPPLDYVLQAGDQLFVVAPQRPEFSRRTEATSRIRKRFESSK